MAPKGLIVPLATPLTESMALDCGGLERLIGHVREGGADALFLLGTTSEAPSLSPATRRAIVDRAAACAGGLDLLVCVTHTCVEESLELAHHAAQAGASAVVAAPPGYYPLSDAELTSYFVNLARRSPLPLVLYNIPVTAHTALTPSIVDRLAQEPRIIGLKDSGGSIAAFGQTLALVRQRSDFAMLVGDESMLIEGLAMGACGGVCGTANVLPGFFRAIIADSARAADAANPWRSRLKRVHRLFQAGTAWSRHIANIKWMVARLGLCQGIVAPPLSEPDAISARSLSELLYQWRADEDLSRWLPAVMARVSPAATARI